MLPGYTIFGITGKFFYAFSVSRRIVNGWRLNPDIAQILMEITANAIWRDPPADTDHIFPDFHDSHLWHFWQQSRQRF